MRASLTALLLLLATAARAELPEIPATPAPIGRLLAARAFTLEAPARYPWDRSQPPAARGYLLVVQAEPGLVVSRQASMPQLMAGGHIAQRASRTLLSGVLVAVVLADIDLATSAVWFSEPLLPEQLTAEDAARQVRLATLRGIGVRPPEELAAALAAGGNTIHLISIDDLAAPLAELRGRFATDEEGGVVISP